MNVQHGYLSDEAGDYDYVGDGIEERLETLSWRLDPEESHSDWTIIVQHAESGTCNVYHVHKNILAVGPWRSDYFVGLFRSTQMAEAQNSTSKITLEDLAANAVPLLLDFLYDPHHQIVISTEHAVALRYLSKYFGMRMLYKRVMQHLKDDMCLNNLGIYVSHARLFHDERVFSLAASKCVDCLPEMNEKLLEAIDSTFLLRILSNPDIDTCSASYQLSKLIARYCQIHRYSLDMETFVRLTNRKYTPLIDRDAALPLLEIESFLQRANGRDWKESEAGTDPLYREVSGTGREEPRSETAAWVSEPDALPLPNGKLCSFDESDSNKKLWEDSPMDEKEPMDSSCLQKRCIHRLALSWMDFAETDSVSSSELEAMSPSVLVSLLQQSTQVAKRTYEEVKENWQKDVLKLRADQENIVCGAIESEINLKQQAESIQREASEKISHMRSLLAEKDRQIREYQTEWDNLERVPAEYSFADETLSTYHHMSGKEPFDHKRNHRVNRYGRVRPTSMPRIGGSSENGLLVIEQDGNNGYKRYPVFYYKGE